jgi:UPF0755 protein
MPVSQMRDDGPDSGAGPTPTDAGPRPDPGPRPGRRVALSERQQGRRQRRRRAAALVAAVTALAILAAGAATYLYVKDYFAVGVRGPAVTVTIPPGSSLREIARLLEKAGVVRHARAFQYRAERDGYESSLRPGTYGLHVNEPYADLVAVLLAGNEAPTESVTIPEGFTARQSGDLLEEKLTGFQSRRYLSLTMERPLPFTLPGFATGGPLEGMLFPATYEVPVEVSERAVVRLQLRTFKERFAEIDLRKARAHNLTDYDVVIIGSMVEREIRVAGERALAAAVMWNRLRIGMPLQIDATVQYALPVYKEQLTYDDLKVESPYNTYLHAGLPPTPICNPGAAALRAAAHPAAVDYLYYVARNDGSGRHFFSSSYEQFLKDKARAESK